MERKKDLFLREENVKLQNVRAYCTKILKILEN